MSLFADLDLYRDRDDRSAAMNMAVDEALLEQATRPLIRFYRWNHPALSFGYFGKFSDVAEHGDKRELVRRWTGGGIVLHGEDLTYTVIIPASHPRFEDSSISIYEKIHRALSSALLAGGSPAELAAVAAVYPSRRSKTKADDRRKPPDPAVIDRRFNSQACFANPVRHDVLLAGRKVAGAAHRRTRAGLLHQGSIQGIGISSDLPSVFARELSPGPEERALDAPVIERAAAISKTKYSTELWLRRR